MVRADHSKSAHHELNAVTYVKLMCAYNFKRFQCHTSHSPHSISLQYSKRNVIVVFFVKYSTNTNGTEEQVASKQ